MRKIFTIFTFFVVVALAGTSYAWQGRMEGMSKPSGLIEDESDLLIHPAKIVSSGEGVKYYLDYQFNYTDVMHWKYKLEEEGFLFPTRFHSSSAKEYDHNSLMGVAFPLAKGRMGVFFSYDNKMGDFDGHGSYDAGLPDTKRLNYDMDNRLDNYALRLIYGLPVRSVDLGFEMGFAYRSEDQNGTVIVPPQFGDPAKGSKNYVRGWDTPELSLFPFMIPYDSSYWELFGKAGVKKKLNCNDIDWSVRGGYILSSDSQNNYKFWWSSDLPTHEDYANMSGDVRGYRIGSDLWVRHQVNEGLTLPFLVSVNYAKKDRDGQAMGIITTLDQAGAPVQNPSFYQYEHITRTFEVKAGGGVEKKVSTCGLIGAGLYYNYLQSRDDVWFFVDSQFSNNQTEFPLNKEHRLVLNLAGEQELSSDLSVRCGLDFFYGWVASDDYKQTFFGPEGSDENYVQKFSLDGSNWGIGASLGATKKFSAFTLEPFLKAGYRKVGVDGNGKFTYITPPIETFHDKMDKERSEWCLGAGFSLLFGK